MWLVCIARTEVQAFCDHGTMMKRAYIFNTGCIRRALDATRICDYLVRNGWAFTNHIRAADLIVVGTCAAVRRNEEFSLTAIQNIVKKKSKSAQVIITGCLPKINPRGLGLLGHFTYIPTRELDAFDSVLDAQIPLRTVPDANMVTNEGGVFDYVLAYRSVRNSWAIRLFKRLSTMRHFLRLCILMGDLSNVFRSRLGYVARRKIVPYYNIRIAEGCMGSCSYCAIRFATGRLQSKPIENIIGEFQAGLKQGYRIFQFIAEDTGCYGQDCGLTITDLLKEIFAIEGEYRLILIDFGPQWLVNDNGELMPLLARNRDKIQEIYVSLQSGSDRILQAMKRPYTIDDVKSTLKELKKNIPGLILRTTVIIGFPGESEEDFHQTQEALQDIGFSEVELNKYEDRAGTESSRMVDKISQDVIERRYRELKKKL